MREGGRKPRSEAMDEPLSEDYRFFGTEPGARDGRDGRGQKRLHGAFTGGFIAGYDNTCGSALSWQPSQERRRKQSIEDFMDDDELEEYNKTVLSAKQQYDCQVCVFPACLKHTVTVIRGLISQNRKNILK